MTLSRPKSGLIGWPVWRQRLLGIDIEGQPADTSREHRLDQSRFVYQRTTRDIDQNRARLQAVKLVAADQSTRCVVENAMRAHEIALPQHGFEIVDLFDAVGGHRRRVDMRVKAKHAGAKTLTRHTRHGAPDLAAPTRPTVLPAMSLPIQRISGQTQPSQAILWEIAGNRFASAIIKANAPSATVSSAYSGTFTTGMPR